jgi:hypothetical protein
VGGAGVGPWRHGSDVAGLEEEESRRCGASTARTDERDNRNWGRNDLLHRLTRGVREAAGRVEAQQDKRTVRFTRLLNSPCDDVHRDGVNHPIEVNGERAGGFRFGAGGSRGDQECGEQDRRQPD